jgi:hypothetical protein
MLNGGDRLGTGAQCLSGQLGARAVQPRSAPAREREVLMVIGRDGASADRARAGLLGGAFARA